MYLLYPYFTNDGSVGLFSPEADDIYHSTYGALTEAYEKFILPANFLDYFKEKSEIKILDICYGIGYNTKSFLDYFLKNIYTDKIDTNNNKYIDKSYTNNKKYKIFVHAVDYDKILSNLSPFFLANKINVKNNKLNFENEKIEKMLSLQKRENYKLKKEVSIILLEKLKNEINKDAEYILSLKYYRLFFDKHMIALYKFLKYEGINNTHLSGIINFLHNIYYNHISNSYKNAMKALNLIDFDFKLTNDDARRVVLSDDNIYNYIFLDAFTPAKCPCLWTLEFFKLLYNHLDSEGMVLTYSNSAAIRNAFVNAGFYVGKIFSETAQKFTGTVAVKNKSLIKNELSEFDLGLMKSKAGIFYRDENLNALNEAIINRHSKDVESSTLVSSSKFIKNFRRKNDI